MFVLGGEAIMVSNLGEKVYTFDCTKKNVYITSRLSCSMLYPQSYNGLLVDFRLQVLIRLRI